VVEALWSRPCGRGLCAVADAEPRTILTSHSRSVPSRGAPLCAAPDLILGAIDRLTLLLLFHDLDTGSHIGD
jgi:hypothetical protein